MTCEPLDVVVVPFPFTDRDASRRRPALVVLSQSFHTRHRQLILAMITSAGTGWPSDVSIRRWQEAGLHVPCKVRLKLFTLDGDRIVRRIGKLSEEDGIAVREALRGALVV